jgi:hypothetical protein
VGKKSKKKAQKALAQIPVSLVAKPRYSTPMQDLIAFTLLNGGSINELRKVAHQFLFEGQ